MQRKTKIICTIGPKTKSYEMLKRLYEAGMNIARINCAHGDYDEYKNIIHNIKSLNKIFEFPIGIMLDIKGPELRTADVPYPFSLSKEDIIKLSYGNKCDLEKKEICVNYPHLFSDVKEKDIITLESGLIELKVLKKEKGKLLCKVLTEGELQKGRRHINLPGIDVSLPSLTLKDRKDLEFGAKMQVDFIAFSFVREKKDILALKKLLEKDKLSAEIIAKIEDQEAITNLDSIIEASDGVMVARGDLGLEVPFEEVPLLQRKIVKKCLELGKPVIIATHLLESMVENPIPTRAELTDVANAVFEEVDAIMLSEETAVGKYPVRAVEMQDRIARRIERDQICEIALKKHKKKLKEEIVRAASFISNNTKAKAIIVITRRGETAKYVASFRPKAPIYAFTNISRTRRRIMLLWGVYPYLIDFSSDPEKTVKRAINTLIENKKLKKGDLIIVVSDILAGKEKVDAIQLRKVK